MRRGFDQPTSSSASRASNTRNREQTRQPSTRTRRPQYDAPAKTEDTAESSEPQSISARRNIEEPPPLLLPALLGDPQPPSSGRKSPAYLEGKNPYGQILDTVEHPYRETQDANEPPSQAGASVEGRPRTSGAFDFKTRPAPAVEPDQITIAPSLEPAIPASRQTEPTAPASRPPPKHVSMQAAKKFFESRVSQSAPLPPPSPAGAAAKNKERSAYRASKEKEKEQEVAAHEKLTQISDSTKPLVPDYNMSEVTLPMPRPPPQSLRHGEPSQRVNPFTRPKAESLAPVIVIRKPTARTNSPPAEVERDDTGVDGDEQTTIGRRRSTNIFNTAPHYAKPLGFERRAIEDGSKHDELSSVSVIAVEKMKRTNQYHEAEKVVRHTTPHTPTSPAETEAAAVFEGPEAQQAIRRSQSGGDVRGAVKDTNKPPATRLRRHGSQGAALTDSTPVDRLAGRTVDQRSTKSANTAPGYKADVFPSRPDRSVDVRKRLEDIPARGLSHDGSCSDPCPSRQVDDREEISPGNMGLQAGYFDIEVPDDIDWRGAHGRRKTQDFGCM